MAQPYVGEIRLFAGNFNPVGWEFCNGQLLSISENETLFQLIGTTYGGDGESTFALPNMAARLPMHQGNGFIVGQAAGVEEVTLTVQQIPSHTHPVLAANDVANEASPQNNIVAQTSTFDFYQSGGANNTMNPGSVSPAGGSQPHTNVQPYVCINFIISLFGIFPSPT
jgi:microcystin-dependent protein